MALKVWEVLTPAWSTNQAAETYEPPWEEEASDLRSLSPLAGIPTTGGSLYLSPKHVPWPWKGTGVLSSCQEVAQGPG